MTDEMDKLRAHIGKLSMISRMPNVEHVADDHNTAVHYLRVWCGLDDPDKACANAQHPAKREDMAKFADYLRAHPEESSEFFRSAGVDEIVAADMIDALLAERERLISALEVVPGPITQEDLDWGVAVHYKNAMQEIEALKDERDALARDAAYWKEEARRYCENADFWRSKFEVAAMKGASNES